MLGHSGPPWQSRAGGARLGSGQFGDASSPAGSGMASRLRRGELAFHNLRQLDDKAHDLVLEDRRPQRVARGLRRPPVRGAVVPVASGKSSISIARTPAPFAGWSAAWSGAAGG